MSRFNGLRDRLAGGLNNGTRWDKYPVFLGSFLDDVYRQVVIADSQLSLRNSEEGGCIA